jgi:hypothetical protein
MGKWIIASRCGMAAVLALLAACNAGDSIAPTQGTVVAASMQGSHAALGDHRHVVQQIYLSYFGRPADPAGLAYFATRLAELGAPTDAPGMSAAYYNNPSIRRFVEDFGFSQEFQSLFQGSHTDFLSQVYRNLFNREPDQAGAAYWIDLLDRGAVSRTNAALAILAGAVGADRELIGKKTAFSEQFTAAVNDPEREKAYSGLDANQLVRVRLAGVSPATDSTAFAGEIDGAMLALLARHSNAFVDVDAGTKRIALLAGPEQLGPNGERLQRLATSLASDLNSRSGQHGPAWDVSVVAAAPNAAGVREQLKSFDGAMLVGKVPVPTIVDRASGQVVPWLPPLQLPHCERYRFDAGGNMIPDISVAVDHDPRCRLGLVLSVVRGRNDASQVQDVGGKLDQMIAYHSASAGRDSAWKRIYAYVQAAWVAGLQWDNTEHIWDGLPLYANSEVSYVKSGSAAQRLDSFVRCIRDSNEICAFDGHGSPGAIQAEGPGIMGEFYSHDTADLRADQLAGIGIKAKFIDLRSCSVQDFMAPGSFGSSLLMGGSALLVQGYSAVSFQSLDNNRWFIAKAYPTLAYGGTIAEAYYGMTDNSPVVLQGDPYITLRPVPQGPQPKLAIDGKHFNGRTMSLPLAFPDAYDGMRTRRIVNLTNPSAVDLHVRLTAIPAGSDVAYGPDGPEPGTVFSLPFELVSPYALSPGTGQPSDLGDIVFTIKPGMSLPVTFALVPSVGADGKRSTGVYSAHFEILSDDPAASRIFLEMRGAVH